MKKIYSSIAILAIASMALFSSCSNNGDDPTPVLPSTPDVKVALNETTNTSASENIYVSREKTSLNLQVSAVSKTTTDMRRIYVFKKSTLTTTAGDYAAVNGTGFKKDGNNYYYDIPANERNNTVLNLTVSLIGGNTLAKSDEYYFAFTDGTSFGGPADTDGMLVGPAQIFIYYGKLSETTGHRLNNIFGPNSGAFDLVTLKNKAASEAATGKDMLDYDAVTSTALWSKSFDAGTSGTLYAKLPSDFDYDNATDISIKEAYTTAANATGTQIGVAAPNMFVAKLRGTETYALIKVTSISDETGSIGNPNNAEFMEFSVKK